MKHNDYELVFLAQEGNEDAINLIYEKYRPIIVKKSKVAIFSAPHHGIEINDIMQEGYIGLEEAINSYSQDNEASFYTFAIMCIDREITNYLRKVTCGKDKILNDAVIIDEAIVKRVKDKMNVESTVLGRDEDTFLTIEIRKILTDFEKKVFDMKLQGCSIEEMARVLNKDVKSIYNTFQRIKMKIKKNIKIDD